MACAKKKTTKEQGKKSLLTDVKPVLQISYLWIHSSVLNLNKLLIKVHFAYHTILFLLKDGSSQVQRSSFVLSDTFTPNALENVKR